jgi:NAD(P)-dependent dehydrogenase (short-subunit alcohol dehydrogenase family)
VSANAESLPSVWLVTGCSTGIGREIALAALARGRRVAVTARKSSAIEDVVAAHPEQAIALALDVTDRAQIERAVRAKMAEQGIVHLPILPEGRRSKTPSAEQILETFRHRGRHQLFDGEILLKVFADPLLPLQKQLLLMLDVPQAGFA